MDQSWADACIDIDGTVGFITMYNGVLSNTSAGAVISGNVQGSTYFGLVITPSGTLSGSDFTQVQVNGAVYPPP